MIKVKGVGISSFEPKICVPVTGQSEVAILTEMKYILAMPLDLLEWRMDCLAGDPLSVADKVAGAAGNIPVIYTMRRICEGGHGNLNDGEYYELLSTLIKTRVCDIIDIDMSLEQSMIIELVRRAKEAGVPVILSKHNFAATDSEEEIISVFAKMRELGADIPKYAAMPSNAHDVLKVMLAGLKEAENHGPVIAVSMGKLGKISRVCGGVFGSAITFASGLMASAPGQIGAEDMRAIIEDLSPEI